MPNGTPHISNGRATIEDKDNDFGFWFEQEYFIMDTKQNFPLRISQEEDIQNHRVMY